MNQKNTGELKDYFRARGLKPKDYLGQNFLIDGNVLDQILKVAELKPTDVVLEVGPGLGVLTRRLAEKASEIWAVEKDQKLIPLLRVELKGQKNVHIVHEDILRFNIAENIKTEYKVVANIPYYLTSKLIQNFLEISHQPKLLVLMVQKEVGERMVAGTGELSLLGISVQIYSDPEIAVQVSRESFWPMPEVDSVILKITPKDKYPELTDKKLFFRILKIAFAGKRKQIANSLVNGLKWDKEKIVDLLKLAKIDPMKRPQDISIEEWIRIYKALDANKP